MIKAGDTVAPIDIPYNVRGVVKGTVELENGTFADVVWNKPNNISNRINVKKLKKL